MKRSRASSRRPSHHQASISQKRQMRKADSGKSEIVRAGVAHHVMSARELLADHPDRAHVARIVWLDQAELGEQQHACIEFVVTERRRERAAFVAPGFFKQPMLDTV